MTKIVLAGKKIQLCYNVSAQQKLHDIMQGDMITVRDYLGLIDTDTEDDTVESVSAISQAEMMQRTCTIMQVLAEGAAWSHNLIADYGFDQTEKWNVLPKEFFLATMQFADIRFYIQAIMSTIKKATAVIVPAELKAEEEDEYLKELEESKNQTAATEKKDSESFIEDSAAVYH